MSNAGRHLIDEEDLEKIGCKTREEKIIKLMLSYIVSFKNNMIKHEKKWSKDGAKMAVRDYFNLVIMFENMLRLCIPNISKKIYEESNSFLNEEKEAFNKFNYYEKVGPK